MIFKLDNLKLKDLYSWLVIITLSSFSLYLFTHKYISNNYYILIISGISGFFLIILYLLLMRQQLHYKEDIFNFVFLIFFVIYGIYFKDIDISILGVLGISLLFFSGKEIVKIYGISQLILVTFLLIFGLFQLIPLITSIQNGWIYDGNVSTLTFGLNKNLVGIFFFNIAIFLFISKKFEKKEWLQYILAVIIGLIIIFLVRDRTVGIILFLFLICYTLIKRKKNISKLSRFLIVLLPIFLTIFSLFLSLNYGKKEWINIFNENLSGRVQYWNYFWNRFSVSLLPQSLTDYFNMYDMGVISTVQYPIDGFYSLGILKDGIIVFTLLIALIMFTLLKLLRNFNKNKFIVIVIISLLLFSLTENIALSYGYICYLFPYILGTFSRDAHNNY
ncbi:hypothetical protein CBF55_01115 [Lactobacillus taiwanensis]|nr:O-antigen polymerase [Lactobacillus taiwanensis]OYS20671.1 hypothetical protein CBF56_00345 [Lactobacillus taiwanensis]OYS25686.1 hypothetical protein CBF55_01115 [Lactobacillus taiwanensis]OYS40853.1 hypothetical protein CBF80_08790 [Lactobacillus taiwanensis]